MKKYTVYEIEKLTKGRFSKYKLTKGIENNKLKAETVKKSRLGRGMPKYYVYEEALKAYLETIKQNEDEKMVMVSDLDFNETFEEKVKKVISKLDSKAFSQDSYHDVQNRLSRLETMFENSVSEPIKDSRKEQEKVYNRRKLLKDLQDIIDRPDCRESRQVILGKLISLS